MDLNPIFVSNVCDIYGKSGEAWLKNLSLRLQELSTLWHFRFLKPMPDLSYHFVGLVEIDDNPAKKAILKMAPPGGSVVSEIRWLNSMESSVPRIYAFDEKENVFLMESLEPGHSLKSLVKVGEDDLATKIICETIRQLQSKQHPNQFQHLSELAKALPILKGRFDSKLLSQAETWFQDLTIDKTHDVVLHGDLHHDNILASGLAWKAIDPQGYMGDPAAEVGVMIRNPNDWFPRYQPLQKVVERRLRIMIDELSFDPKRIKMWAFCMTVLSIAWTLEGHGKIAELETEVAVAVDKTKI